jgi:hypothetical protein
VSSLHGETVVAAYDHAVFLLHLKNKHSTLASVLGVYTNATKRNAIDTPALPNSAINWGDVASDKVDLDQWHHTLCSDDVHEQQLISELMDATAKISTASFQKKFNAAVQKLGGTEQLSYRFLMAATRRCLESADKVPLWGPLKAVIETKRLSSRALPSLLPTLMKHSQFELLELAITHLADLDERAIVRLLRFFIRKSETKALASYVHKKIATSTTTPSERFIVALLGLPTNSVFLHHAIRELQLSEVLLLLAVCKKFFWRSRKPGLRIHVRIRWHRLHQVLHIRDASLRQEVGIQHHRFVQYQQESGNDVSSCDKAKGLEVWSLGRLRLSTKEMTQKPTLLSHSFLFGWDPHKAFL